MPSPIIRGSDEINYESQSAAEGLHKGVLIGAAQDAPNFWMRRFTLEAGKTVPKHTNAVEHEQYVLEGEYIIGIRADGTDTEYEVEPGDSLLIPAETVHWYRNTGDTEAAFICVVPNSEDEIELVE
ncbi:cupin domain-containing protein [Halodesulfurarchaeum sp.]|uniref:cupin domain-containing protein n=1 Tax=Halodesulfurarchaeum sp. TaxID=1980530 RepID=UPI001BC102B2|nr:cupin domain-containing protein [Halodesulfurarchaeum sp.]